MSQAKPPFKASPPPPPRKLRRRIFHVVKGNVRVAGAKATRHGYSPDGGGRAGWSANQCHSITDHRIGPKFNMKMDNCVLLLCYLDKICLTLTGNLWRALASLYSEGEAIHIREPEWRLALSRLHYILQAAPLCERRKSATATHLEQ